MLHVLMHGESMEHISISLSIYIFICVYIIYFCAACLFVVCAMHGIKIGFGNHGER